MDRRNCLLALAALALAPRAAHAQQPARIWRVGILEPTHANARTHLVLAFKTKLRDLGYEEGRNLTIESRFADGKLENLPALATELVRLKVDIIVAATTPSIRAAANATRTIPIVMATVGDPVEAGFVASFARPGGNITGRTTQAPELMTKRVQLLKEAAPKTTRIAVLWDSRNSHETQGLSQATLAAERLNVTLRAFDVQGEGEIEAAFGAMARDKVDALMVFENATNNSFRSTIVDVALRQRLPGIFPFRDFTESGGLMSFGPALLENYRQAAVYVDKIFKGASPANLPVEQPTTFELVINLATARALSISPPPALLARTDELIRDRP